MGAAFQKWIREGRKQFYPPALDQLEESIKHVEIGHWCGHGGKNVTQRQDVLLISSWHGRSNGMYGRGWMDVDYNYGKFLWSRATYCNIYLSYTSISAGTSTGLVIGHRWVLCRQKIFADS